MGGSGDRRHHRGVETDVLGLRCGTVNADVLEHLVPGFRRTDFVDVIKNSAWSE
jgi:hypothetical protein